MSIHSPLKDGLYIRPDRPERHWIRYFIKNYPNIVGILISLVLAFSLFTVTPRLTTGLLILYWIYIYVRRFFRKNKRLSIIYSGKLFQVIRVVSLVLGVSALLYYVYNKTNYLNVVQDDTLWLLYFPAISVTSQRSSRKVFFIALLSVLACLYFVHPTNGMTYFPILKDLGISLEFLIKSTWLVFLTLTSYILIRYMSDAVADLNLIIKVQNRMRELEGSLLRSKVEVNENDYLERAVDVIKDDLKYNHVNIFRLDKYSKHLTCIAGACQMGKELARSGYSLELIGGDSIIGYVINSQSSYVSNDVLNDPHYLSHEAFPDTKAELVVPIKVRNRLYGVLDIEVHQRDYFLDQEIKAIEILANHIGWVIDNSEQFSHNSWINRIVETIAAPIFTQTHLEETLQEIADSAAKELDADLVFLYSYDDGSKDKVSGPIYSGMLLHPELMDYTSVDHDNVVFRLLANGERIYIHENLENLNVTEHFLFKPSPTHIRTGRPTFIEREKIKSNVIIRLHNDNECVGILFLNFREIRTFNDWEKKRYFSFAHLAAMAIQKMQIQQKTIQKEKADLAVFNHNSLIGGTFGLFRLLRDINLNSEHYSNEKLQETIEAAINATEQIHNSIRWIDRMLKEEGIEDFMLELDKLKEFFKHVYNVKTEIKWVGNSQSIPQPLAIELSLVAREALTNAVRHGKAKNIIVNSVVKPEKISCTIIDDGIGFNPKLVKRMNGLLSMKNRIEEIRGVFKLTSNPGKGTKIVVQVPFQNSPEAKNG